MTPCIHIQILQTQFNIKQHYSRCISLHFAWLPHLKKNLETKQSAFFWSLTFSRLSMRTQNHRLSCRDAKCLLVSLFTWGKVKPASYWSWSGSTSKETWSSKCRKHFFVSIMLATKVTWAKSLQRVSLLRNNTSICFMETKIPWVCKCEKSHQVSNRVLKWWHLPGKNGKQSHRSKTIQYGVNFATSGLSPESS